MLRLAFRNFEFLPSNVVLVKTNLLLPSPVLLLPEVAYCPIKSMGFSYKYLWIQVSLELTIHLGDESFATKKFAKFSVQTFANDKMTSIFHEINFGDVEIYINVLNTC